ncbi:MAG: CPBP family intramembrane glutamic endopeptidase [Gaiellaceae bacterium]
MSERLHGGRLSAWAAVATALIALGFASYATSSSMSSAKEALFSWSFAASNAVFLGIWIAISLAISSGLPELRALRPSRIGGGKIAALGALAVAAMLVANLIVNSLGGHPAREQQLLTGGWQSGKLAPFIASVLILTVLTPFTEELFVRGLGFSLVSPFGRVAAATVPALAWALMHGLPAAIFPLFVFGVGLGYLRERSDSCVPGMVVHGLYNGLAVALAYST